MARILVSCFSPVSDQGRARLTCMLEGFIEALKAEGNDVRIINTSEFLPRPWNGSNDVFPSIDGPKLAADIRAFAPDLAFAFNHSIPAPVLAELHCPIVLWDNDSIQFYSDKDVIRRDIGRYHFFCFSRHGVANAVQFGAPKERVFFVPAATAVRAETREQRHNISFIGSMFRNYAPVKDFIRYYENRADRDAIIDLVRRGYDHINAPFVVERRQLIEKYVELPVLFSIYSPGKRLDILNAVADLGLALYGTADWIDAAEFFPDLALAHDPTLVYSLRHNQDVYNASKLCLNICHAQAVDGYAWRVLDILASNGCLLSDRKQGIADLLQDYIDLPMYENPAEARELAQRLLRDESWRQDIVAASHKCIEDKGRWRSRFLDMQAILSVQLIADERQAGGSITTFDPKNYARSVAHTALRAAVAQGKKESLRQLLYRLRVTRWLLAQPLIRSFLRHLGIVRA